MKNIKCFPLFPPHLPPRGEGFSFLPREAEHPEVIYPRFLNKEFRHDPQRLKRIFYASGDADRRGVIKITGRYRHIADAKTAEGRLREKLRVKDKAI